MQNHAPRLYLVERQGAIGSTKGHGHTCSLSRQTVRIHPRAVRGHLGGFSCDWTMNAVAPGREPFVHQQIWQQGTAGTLAMQPASWAATPSPEPCQRAGGRGETKGQQETHPTGRQSAKAREENHSRAGPRGQELWLWSGLTWVQSPFKFLLAV